MAGYAQGRRSGNTRKGGSPRPPEPKKSKGFGALAELKLIAGTSVALIEQPSEPLASSKPKGIMSEEDSRGIDQPVCMICTTECIGYYGRWGDTGTCSSKCEQVYKAKRS